LIFNYWHLFIQFSFMWNLYLEIITQYWDAIQFCYYQNIMKSNGKEFDGREKLQKQENLVIWLQDMNECIYRWIHSSHYVYSGHQSYSWADVWKPLSIEWIALGPKQHSLSKKAFEYSFIVSSICHHLYCKDCLKDFFVYLVFSEVAPTAARQPIIAIISLSDSLPFTTKQTQNKEIEKFNFHIKYSFLTIFQSIKALIENNRLY
jgi:hypothetical protein